MKTYLKYILSILLTVILICGGILVYSVITPVEDTNAPEKTNAVTKAVSADRFAFADRFDLLPDNVSGARVNVDEYGVVLERFKSYGFKDAFVKYPR